MRVSVQLSETKICSPHEEGTVTFITQSIFPKNTRHAYLLSLIYKQPLITSKRLESFLKFRRKLKSLSISATSVIFLLPSPTFHSIFLSPSRYFSPPHLYPAALEPSFSLLLSSLRQLASLPMGSLPFYSNIRKGCA